MYIFHNQAIIILFEILIYYIKKNHILTFHNILIIIIFISNPVLSDNILSLLTPSGLAPINLYLLCNINPTSSKKVLNID